MRNAYPDVNSPPSLPSLSLYLRREIRCSSPLEERTHARPYQPAAQCHLKSRLLQACGVVAGTPCGHCARGFGRWEACIVNDPHSADDPLHGSCANCFYSGQSKRCSLRQSLSRAIIKNDKAATLDDVLSRTFPDLESAEQALNGHLQPNGFRMARRVSNRNATGDFISRHYACVRYQWLKSPLQNHLCPWRITIKRKDDFWVVASPRGEHNHPPVDHYNPKEKWRCPVSQCKRVMPMSEKETHICGPPLTNCWRCGLRLLKSEQAAHLKICKWYRCSKCRKHGILRTEKEKHSQECTGQQSFSCNRCRKSFANLQEHYKVCEYWKCPRCRKEKILASEKLEHAKACSKLLPAVCRKCAKHGTHQYIRQHEAACKVHVCPQCRIRGSKVKILAHMRICRRTLCSSCGRRISLDEDHHCQFKRCNACRARVHNDLVDKHMSDCPGWSRNWNKVPLRAGPSPAPGAILAPKTKFPLLRDCVSTMTAWMKYPANTAIADFEFITFPGSLRFPCQVAIADGYGEWIIAPTTINHGITKGALLDRIMSIRALTGPSRCIGAATVHTYYPGRREEITQGKSCQEIADLIDQYVKVSKMSKPLFLR